MTEERTFDWVPRFDERSRGYSIRSLVPSGTVRRRNKIWKLGPILDQASEGACVGFGWTAEALANPIGVNLENMLVEVPRGPDGFARHVYRAAQKIDEWEGEAYEGTSVLAGAKVMNQLHLLRSYHWAFDIEAVADAVIARGPVVIGIPWYSGMYEAPGGILTPRGYLVGGHCLVVVGYVKAGGKVFTPKGNLLQNNTDEDTLVLQNSWGSDWGIDGLALIRKTDLKNLLADHGEACIPTSRSFGKRPL
jgi:hypothetical protein